MTEHVRTPGHPCPPCANVGYNSSCSHCDEKRDTARALIAGQSVRFRPRGWDLLTLTAP